MRVSHSRVDRFVTLRIVRPVRRICARPTRPRIPILMYHSVSETSFKGVHPYFALETSPKVFAAQMTYLHESGYKTISTADLVRLLCENQLDSEKYALITFDDGYRDFYTHAFPVLNNFGFTSTIYLPSAYIGNRSRRFLEKDCLTWPEVRELHGSGVIVGSHTASHARLDDLAESALEHEIQGSKEMLENELGSAITTFAYPYAFPDRNLEFAHRLRDVLKMSGYHDGVAKIIGTKHTPEERFFLRRIPINTADQISLFAAKLEGDYDWLHGAQSIAQTVKRFWPKADGNDVSAQEHEAFSISSISDSVHPEAPPVKNIHSV
jgi:peptidoglycan/xylan/chitin deacetylase (PgdA/CDA1 family)